MHTGEARASRRAAVPALPARANALPPTARSGLALLLRQASALRTRRRTRLGLGCRDGTGERASGGGRGHRDEDNAFRQGGQ